MMNKLSEPVGALYTLSGVQHCTITQTLPDTDLYSAEQMAAEIQSRDEKIADLQRECRAWAVTVGNLEANAVMRGGEAIPFD